MKNHSVFTAHPWHGVSPGDNVPELLTAFIEVVPTDTVKYEIDKESGLLKVDRPQKFSNICPALYGFIPRTYCGEKVAEYCMTQAKRVGMFGDGDPLDICILSEKQIMHGNILMQAIPIGGLRMIDNNEADDKIIAVMKNDAVYGQFKDILDCPQALTDRLRHYFLTYKQQPGETHSLVEITHIYGVAEAHEVIKRSLEDYSILQSAKQM
ncbi:MAG: inorganic pyrophosphatase [Bacteroidia bacterium]|nr:inorganic pyrophosphatase [Bacteroidia bacterium]